MKERSGIRVRVAGFDRRSDIGYGIARIDPIVFSALGTTPTSNIALLHGTGGGEAVVRLMRAGAEDEGSNVIHIDAPTRHSAGVSNGDSVDVSIVPAPEAVRITIAPISGSVDDIPKTTLLKNLANRPLVAGMEFMIPNISLMGSDTLFTVLSSEPRGPVTVSEMTELTVGKARKEDGERDVNRVLYSDIGGLDKEIERIREMVEWPLARPDVYRRLGMDVPKGVLLHGPPGTGKTLIAEAIANESGAYFISVRGPEIFSAYVGSSENNLKKIFEEAEKNAPAIIFFDEFDAIARKRDDGDHSVAQNVLTMLLTLMDGIGSKDNVIVIAATNRIDDIDPAFRRPGRFDREIEIGIPSLKGRRDILGIRTVERGMPLDSDVDLDAIAKMTQGFTGADIAALATEAANRALLRMTKGSREALDALCTPEALDSMKVTMRDFTDALSDVRPSGMREVSGGIPSVTWDDIGGLENVHSEIEEMIPGKQRERMERLGIKPGKGVLLFGPPGTGKTLIAKAVANEKGLNFIPVNGPELLSHWVGDSEKGLRKVFERAKNMAPSVIFFDEIDSIAPKRGSYSSGVYESMVAQLLTCLDGVTELKDVLVLAATNRPDIIDPAVLRPGRIDRLVLVNAPDEGGRLDILRVCSRGMPLSPDVDLGRIAELTDGYVGADLEKLCREAGISAYRRGADAISYDDFDAALRKVLPSAGKTVMETYAKLAGETAKSRSRWEEKSFYQ